MREETFMLLSFSILLLTLFVGLSVLAPAKFQTTVPCKWLTDKILFGGRATYYCYLSFTPTTSGTYSYYLSYPGNVTNLRYAKIGIYDVQTPIEHINISGSVAPNSRTYRTVSIPETAYDVAIYGEIIGKPSDGDYPDNPYIRGGVYELTCGIQCKYNKGLIIDRPGTYNLEIYSGLGGNGIDYVISGSYKLPPASLNVTYDGTQILYIQAVRTITVQDITDKINKSSGYLVFSIDGKPAFRIVFESEMVCSLSGTEWNCESYYQKGANYTTVICRRIIESTCNFKGLQADIPLDISSPYSEYFKDASEASMQISTTYITVQPGSSEILVSDLPEGKYIAELVFKVPYIVPEAKEAIGQCVIDKSSIEVYGEPGEYGATTISIRNIGEQNILVKVYPSEEVSEYVSVTPYQQVIPAGESKSFNVEITLPEAYTELSGNIVIEGCAEESIYIPVKLSTVPIKIWFIEYLPSIIIIGLSSIILIISRPYIEKYVGKKMSYIFVIGLIITITIIFLFVFPIRISI